MKKMKRKIKIKQDIKLTKEIININGMNHIE